MILLPNREIKQATSSPGKKKFFFFNMKQEWESGADQIGKFGQ